MYFAVALPVVSTIIEDQIKDIEEKVKLILEEQEFKEEEFKEEEFKEEEFKDKELKEEKFKHPELVFSGHFHTRQAKDKIIYIGNAFPHNYADAWDDERGMMMLDWGHDPEFITWPDQPTYRTLTLSLLLEDPEKFLQKKTNARINLDIDITYEEANFLKELFTDIFKLRDFALLPTKDTEHEEGVIGEIQFQSIDQIVISHLQNIESDTFDSRVLIAIYNSLQYAKN